MLHIAFILRLLLILHIVAIFSCKNGSPAESIVDKHRVDSTGTNDADFYALAIRDFIYASKEKDLIQTDTLFLIKRKNNLADDFPDIKLPPTIANKVIALVDTNTVAHWKISKPKNILINLIGWIDTNKAEFMFVTFYHGLEHQYDYHSEYQYSTGKQPILKHASWEMF